MRRMFAGVDGVGTLELSVRMSSSLLCGALVSLVVSVSVGCAQTSTSTPPPVDDGSVTQRLSAFDRCVAEGGSVLKSYPPQCVTKTGEHVFAEAKKPAGGRTCKDKCGDGVCDEMVCMMLGCPCAETEESCPQDCD